MYVKIIFVYILVFTLVDDAKQVQCQFLFLFYHLKTSIIDNGSEEWGRILTCNYYCITDASIIDWLEWKYSDSPADIFHQSISLFKPWQIRDSMINDVKNLFNHSRDQPWMWDVSEVVVSSFCSPTENDNYRFDSS